MITSTTKPRAGAVIAAMALLLSGCAVAPDYYDFVDTGDQIDALGGANSHG